MIIVEVSWLDTLSRHLWSSRAAADSWLDDDTDGHGGMLHKYVGYLYKTTDKYVAIVGACAAYEEGNITDLTQFPRAIVVEVRNVKTGRKVRLP